MSAYQTQSDAPVRKDNLLGICHAIGEDFGFNPIFLRIPLAAMIIVSAKWTLIAYAAMGVAVLASRLLIRKPKVAKPAALMISRPNSPETEKDMALAA
jgi:phage shock protein PspC (stress-responsive transcriptional regulator)